MARWRVTAKHYINARQFGEDTTWVREETNRDTGRAFRRTFQVPLYIDPEDPICINKNVGYCVVATEGHEMPGDIILDGPPTPDMEPMDDHARELTAAEAPKWKDPINGLPIQLGENFGDQLLAMLSSQVNSASKPGNTSLNGVGSNELAELKAMIAEQAKQINQLMSGGTVVSAGEPLPEIEPDLPLAPPPTVAKPSNARRL